MKKVLFLGLHPSRKSGVSKAQIELASALRAEGLWVDALSAQSIPGHDYTLSSGETIHFSSLDDFLLHSKQEGNDYDILHVHSWAWSPKEMPLGGLAKVKGLFDSAGVVHTFHSFIPNEYDAQRSILDLVDLVTLLSPAAEASFVEEFSDLSGGLPPYRILPNVVTTNDLDSAVVDSLKSQIAPLGETVLLYVGRLDDNKGVLELAEAFKVVYPKYESVKLVVIGSKSHSDPVEYRKIMEKMLVGTNVHFTGWIEESEVAAYQRIANLQIAPSRFEAFPLGIAKGVLNGCVVAISDIPSHREIYHLDTPEPLAIKISSPCSVDAIVLSMREFLDAPHNFADMVRRGQEELQALYSPKKVAQQYIQAYEEIC
ncbi:MAG: glycosyltransferase family 4 protein [archaeon]